VAHTSFWSSWERSPAKNCEDVRRIFIELVLHGLAGVRGDRCDVDQADHALVDARGRDGGAAVGMAHENDGTADSVKRALHGSHVLFERV
jgi:hypothetical protein